MPLVEQCSSKTLKMVGLERQISEFKSDRFTNFARYLIIFLGDRQGPSNVFTWFSSFDLVVGVHFVGYVKIPISYPSILC